VNKLKFKKGEKFFWASQGGNRVWNSGSDIFKSSKKGKDGKNYIIGRSGNFYPLSEVSKRRMGAD